MTGGEALYAAGLVFAEALRFGRRIDRAQQRGARRSQSAERIVLGWILLGIWILPLLSIFTPWLARFDLRLPAWAVGAGAVSFLASLALRWQAQRALGRHWSHTLETGAEQALVTHGIYARVRHPLYASLVLWAIAQPLILANVVAGLGGVIAVSLVWLVRVPREEAMLLEHFGAAYEAYRARTGRLFPKRR